MQLHQGLGGAKTITSVRVGVTIGHRGRSSRQPQLDASAGFGCNIARLPRDGVSLTPPAPGSGAISGRLTPAAF